MDKRIVQQFSWFYFLTWIATFAFDLIGIAIVLLSRVLYGKNLHWNNGVWCTADKESTGYQIINKVFRALSGKNLGGLTLMHCGVLLEGKEGGPGIDTDIELHEHRHVEQGEAASWAAVFYAALELYHGHWGFAIFIWATGGFVYYLAGGVAAVMRGESFYLGNHLEEAAYAQDDLEEALKDKKHHK